MAPGRRGLDAAHLRKFKPGWTSMATGKRPSARLVFSIFGASQGCNYGTDLMAVEEGIRAAALGFVGGPRTEYRRLAPANKSLIGPAATTDSFASQFPRRNPDWRGRGTLQHAPRALGRYDKP